MAGRQGTGGSRLRYGTVAPIFFLEQHFMCVALIQPNGNPSIGNLVPLKINIVQHRVQQTSRFTSAQVDLTPAGNTSLARFGIYPSVAR